MMAGRLRNLLPPIRTTLLPEFYLADPVHAFFPFSNHHPVSAVLFCLVKCLVGLFHQFSRRFTKVRIDRDPDGYRDYAHITSFIAQAESFYGLANVSRAFLGDCPGGARQAEYKFFTAEAAGNVFLAAFPG